MISVDSIIEPSGLFLLNMITSSTDDWTSGTGYGFKSLPYDSYLIPSHYYYRGFEYYFTTTDQSPTWCEMYMQSGSVGGPRINNPIAGTEYFASDIRNPNSYAILSYGTLHNGVSGKINGVTSYSRKLFAYDVTDLFAVLKALNIATTTTTLKTWCDEHIGYHSYGEKILLSDLIPDLDKIYINLGKVIANDFTETLGMDIFNNAINSAKGKEWFDNQQSPIGVYNNKGGGTVTHVIVDSDSPYKEKHPYMLKITTNGLASPSAGGFYPSLVSSSGKIFLLTILAKVPLGYYLNPASNSVGDGGSHRFISSTVGTGDWLIYLTLVTCGTSGSFSSTGHIYCSGPNNASVTWYVAYTSCIDITNKPDYKGVLIPYNLLGLKGTTFLSELINETNLIPNGDLSDSNMIIPNGWEFDEEDHPAHVKRSLVLPINVGQSTVFGKLLIDPTAKYKISCWIKCKNDMTSFLTYVLFYTSDGINIQHTNHVYTAGTRTQLSLPLKKDDTVAYLKSVDKWVANSVSHLGARTNYYTYSYNNLGTSPIITDVDTTNNSVTFKSGWTGNDLPVNTWVVNSKDGGSFKYPFGKEKLPTDNTWKYMEAYIGTDGSASNGEGNEWAKFPSNTAYITIGLNLYKNTASTPIKYADVRLEQVGKQGGTRLENKIQIPQIN